MISRSNGGVRPVTRHCAAQPFQEAIVHLGKAIAMADNADATGPGDDRPLDLA